MNNNRSEKEKALRGIQELAFGMQESVLFLDGHPDSTSAMRYYDDLAHAYENAVRDWESKYGPLTVTSALTHTGNGDGGWRWVKTPWPWEVAYPDASDFADLVGNGKNGSGMGNTEE